MLRRNDDSMRSAGHPTLSIVHTVSRPTNASSVVGRVDGSQVPGVRMGSVEPVGSFAKLL